MHSNTTVTTNGLEDIIAGDTSICYIDKNGSDLIYRGYSVKDLAKDASFEQVASLLINDQFLIEDNLKDFNKKLSNYRFLPTQLIDCISTFSEQSSCMDVLRTAVSYLGLLDFSNNDLDIAYSLIARLPLILGYWLKWNKFKNDDTVIKNKILEFKQENLSHAEYVLKNISMNDVIDEKVVKALNTSLILYAEHEFNASTFSARVTAATLSDFYSCITSAIGTLKGKLHGGANEAAMELITSCKNVDHVEKVIDEKLANKERIMGFGHRIYTDFDPRSIILREIAKDLSKSHKDAYLFDVAEKIVFTMNDRKKLFPNVDFYGSLVFHYCGIPKNLFTSLFAIARLSGWSAHVIEQKSHNRLIRPIANYVGNIGLKLPIQA